MLPRQMIEPRFCFTNPHPDCLKSHCRCRLQAFLPTVQSDAGCCFFSLKDASNRSQPFQLYFSGHLIKLSIINKKLNQLQNLKEKRHHFPWVSGVIQVHAAALRVLLTFLYKLLEVSVPVPINLEMLSNWCYGKMLRWIDREIRLFSHVILLTYVFFFHLNSGKRLAAWIYTDGKWYL